MRRQKQILIADDEPKVRSLFHKLFKEAGFSTLEAEDGERALKLIRLNRDAVDLMVLDIRLPKANGLDIFDAVKKEFPDIKVIVSSVCTRQEQEFLIMKADDYYDKTESISMLIEKINLLLKR